MLSLPPDKLLAILLGASLLLMAAINVYTLLHLLFRIDAKNQNVSTLAAPGNEVPAEQADTAWLARLGGLFGAIDTDGLGEVAKNIDQSAAILGSLAAIGNDGFSGWREANQQRIESLLAEHRRRQQQLIQLHDSLTQAHATIETLRSQVPRSALASAQVAALKAQGIKHEATIRQMSAEHIQQQREQHAARQQLELFRAEAAAGRQALESLEGANARLVREVDELRTATRMLEESNADLQATHERTILEKLFVEEAFVELDKHLSAQVQAVDQGLVSEARA